MTSDRDAGQDGGAASDPPQRQVECVHCYSRILGTLALHFEGSDYLYHFCGPGCFEAWRKSNDR